MCQFKMDFKKCVSTIWIAYWFLSRTYASEVEIQLIDGQAPNQGRVMMRKRSNVNDRWRPLCAQGFNNNTAAVVCRQLGYKYSLNEPKVYESEIPDWINLSFDCHGNESDIGECLEGKQECYFSTDFYAAVCCSNSAEFGEWTEGRIFKSHCADTWLASQKRCETLHTSLTIFTEEDDDISFNTSAEYVWNGQFFTPWIWSDDCVQFTRSAMTDFKDIDISNNSPGMCFQICGKTPGTVFVLSGHRCRCILNNQHIESVKPKFCKSKCPGKSDQYCGDGRQGFWDMYKIGSKDDEFASYSSSHNDTRQCAGFIQNVAKLRSQNCDKKVGFICSQFKNIAERGHIPFRSPEISLSDARQFCRNNTDGWKLAGSDVITAKIFSSLPDGPWVDIESSLVPIYSSESYPASSNIDPEHCQAINTAKYPNSAVGFKLLDCKNERLLYSCSRIGSSETSRRTKAGDVSYDTPTKTTTVILEDDTESTRYINTSSGSTTKDVEIWQIAIAVLIAFLLTIVFVVIFVCWRARKRRLRHARGETAAFHDDLNTGGDCSALSPSSPTLDHYEMVTGVVEIEDMQDTLNQPPNVYEELTDKTASVYSELVTDTGEQDGRSDILRNGAVSRKESLKLKDSYVTPKDSVRENLVVKKSHNTEANDPYSMPYDSLKSARNGPLLSDINSIEENTA